MKTIKKRIKRALASLLREELLEYIGYNHNIPYMPLETRFNVQQMEFDTVVMEQTIAIDQNDHRFGQRFDLEQEIHNCKRKFAEKVMENIHVDARNLTSPEHYMQRSVQFVLRVQKPQR